MSIAISIIVTMILVLGNGYFSASEMALVNARKTKLQARADEGDEGAQRALEVAGDSDKLLATIQVFITLLGFFASAVSATTFSGPLASWLEGFGLSTSVGEPLATVLITIIISYVTIVLGELLPKRMGLADPEGMSIRLAPSIAAFETIAKPLVWATSASSNALAKVLGIKNTDDRQGVSEEEIKYIVTDNDELLPDEKRMIHEIIDLGDTAVHDIMTPRADMIFVEDTDTVKYTLERMRGTGYSRLPVYHEDYDRIVGLIKYKDLVPALMDDRGDEAVGQFVSKAFFVPETKDIFPLLSEMQTSRQQMAIVVDEYGGTDGLITIEDIVEEIVGEIIDETDLESKYVTQMADDEWLVNGSMPVEDAIEMGWPLQDSEEYETIAGWLIDFADTIPEMGDEFEVDGYRFTVQGMRRHRIKTMRVQRISLDASADVDKSDDSDSVREERSE